MKLPSEKLFLFAFPLIIILGIFVMVKQHSTPVIKNSLSPKVVSVQNTIITNTDTDSDGVPDWEEIIWKTDPTKSNTHGIPDKDYIAKKSIEEKSVATTTGSINQTEELSHELFAQYMALQQAGQLNEATIQTLTERIANNIDAKPLQINVTEENIKTFPDSDIQGIQKYANSLISIKESYVAKFDKQTGGKTITLEDPNFSSSMVFASGLYTKFANDLVKIPVPQGIVRAHIAYIQSIQQSAQGLLEFSHFSDDPITAMPGIQRHSAGEEAQTSAINSITNFLSQNGIISFNLSPF